MVLCSDEKSEDRLHCTKDGKTNMLERRDSQDRRKYVLNIKQDKD